MFQPHSVRGLLSRRNVSRITEDNPDSNSHKDPDLESVVEAKLMIKDIQHQIDDIRTWREHQKSIVEQRLASNKAVLDVMKESYQRNSEEEEKRLLEERQNILKQLQKLQYQCEQEEEREELRGDTNLFEYITNSNNFLEEVKRGEVESEVASLRVEQDMLNQIEGLGEMITSKIADKGVNQNKKTLDRNLLKKELEEIDAQLKEAQELLNS